MKPENRFIQAITVYFHVLKFIELIIKLFIDKHSEIYFEHKFVRKFFA